LVVSTSFSCAMKKTRFIVLLVIDIAIINMWRIIPKYGICGYWVPVPCSIE
jgi:hypothetical protein